MAITSSSQIVLGAAPDSADTIPNREILVGTNGITVQNSAGGSSVVSLQTASNAAGLNSLSGTGFPALTSANTFTLRQISAADSTITVSNSAGTAANVGISQTAYTANQLIDAYETAATTPETRTTGAFINFIPGANIGINVASSTYSSGHAGGGIDVTINNIPNPGIGLTVPWLDITGTNPSTGHSIDLTDATGPINVGNNQLLDVQSIQSLSGNASPPPLLAGGWTLFGSIAGPAGAGGVPCFQVEEVADGVTGWVPLVNASTQGPLGTGNAIPVGVNQIMYSNGNGFFDISPASTTAGNVLQISGSGKAVWGSVPAGTGLPTFTALPPQTDPYTVSGSEAYVVPDNDAEVYTIQLPTTVAFGEQIIISNQNLSGPGANIMCGDDQFIQFLEDEVSGITGYLGMREVGATITLLCIEPNTGFTVINSMGGENGLITY